MSSVYLTACVALLVVIVHAIPRSEFYPFGEDAGDEALNNQDYRRYSTFSPPISANVTMFPFFGKHHDTIFVSGGGYIAFNNSHSHIIASQEEYIFTDVVVPFWFYGHYYFRRNFEAERLWYRTTTDPVLLEKARRDIQRGFVNQADFHPSWMLVATWKCVDIEPYDDDDYFYDNDEDEVTFQCMLASDGTRSFAIFYYDDSNSMVAVNDVFSILSAYGHMGYSTLGNSTTSTDRFLHPQSFSLDILNVFNTSNVGVPGVWIFRLDTSDAALVGCQPRSFGPISVEPRTGNMLGGTAVKVNGPCLNRSDTLFCNFGGIEVAGTFIDETSLICVSPTMRRFGRVSFTVTVQKSDQQMFTYISTFTAVPPANGHIVDILSDSLLLKSKQKYEVTWNPHKLLSPKFGINTTMLSVDIHLYYQKYTYIGQNRWSAAEWIPLRTPVAKEIQNSEGRAEIAMPKSPVKCRVPVMNGGQIEVCPIAFKLSLSEGSTEQIFSTDIGLWSGVAFLQSITMKIVDLYKLCEDWGEIESRSGIGGESLFEKLLPCPPTQVLAILDANFEQEGYTSMLQGTTQYASQIMSFFHPEILSCYIQVTPIRNSGHQCCYNAVGNLVLGAPGGGSASVVSSKVDFNRHLSDDMLPYALCCQEESGSNCDTYYEWRPSQTRRPYVLPLPACIYGDPHIITLDGLKYTFNGKGEFTLIETSDNSFTLQGRMDTIRDQKGNPTLGTVFTALVAREDYSNTTAQFELGAEGVVDILVNEQSVEFDDLSEIILDNITLFDSGNNTVTANFAGGAKMELTVENSIISVMLITLPDSFKGMTSGLMGSFNGDSSDDLVPKGQSKPISFNASIEEIHKDFGVTWIIIEPNNSLFTYNTDESWETFYDPDFSPSFQPSFENVTLEEQAREVCGNDEFCLFDIAATKRIEIGAATMEGVENFDVMVEMATPIVCDPPCENGACVQNDTCSCSDGYEGNTCNVPLMVECEENVCENNGTCMRHVLTYMCECLEGFVGAFCQEKELPFRIQLVNSSPRVNNGTVLIDFQTTMPIQSADCFLTGQRPRRCGQRSRSGGQVTYSNLPAGTYIFRVQAQSLTRDKSVVRRIVHIGESANADFCAVHFINEGLIVDGTSASMFFQGTTAVDSYLCRLRGQNMDTGFTKCRSPNRYSQLETGEYHFQVLPVGCDKGKRLSMQFNIF